MSSTNRDGETGEGGNDNTRSWLAYFGEELRVARELRQMSVRQLASHTSYSYQQVSNVEAGRRTPSEAFTREVDAALETGGRFARILRRVLTEALPDWFRGAAQEEGRATRIQTFQSQVVHGLLQTEEYARGLIRGAQPRATHDRVEALVAGEWPGRRSSRASRRHTCGPSWTRRSCTGLPAETRRWHSNWNACSRSPRLPT